tara:strand:- start:1093 stop:1362 length:270 start_codon:yes stop_codon:yes gene_type:complete
MPQYYNLFIDRDIAKEPETAAFLSLVKKKAKEKGVKNIALLSIEYDDEAVAAQETKIKKAKVYINQKDKGPYGTIELHYDDTGQDGEPF